MSMADANASVLRLADLADLRAAVWGYGREGRAAVAALRKRFPRKMLTVFCSEAEALASDSACSATLSPIEGNGGEGFKASAALNIVTSPPNVDALAAFDIIIKSPGISPYKSPVPAAEAAGVRFTSGSALWFAENPTARTICVTGTKGKSTVTALIAHLLRKSGKCVALAGNIGLPLLELLDPPRQPDWWVIELSSFQTRDFGGTPSVAVLNNLYEEHLDWHGTRERYAVDKLAIAARAQRLVINASQPELLTRTAGAALRTTFGGADGWHVRAGAICRAQERVLDARDLPLPGEHNAQNVCAALAAIEAAGEDARGLARHVRSFKPLPHRLQLLGVRDGIAYVNDSIATTPYATIEALRSVAGAASVIVGGFDRGVDWRVFVEYATKYPPRAIVTTGSNGPRIAAALSEVHAPGFALASAPSLDQALQAARALMLTEGTILLSPGAPSFDQFHDYAERGREFARLAGFDPDEIAQIEGLGIA